MKKIFYTFIAGLSFLFTSCGDSPESLAKDMISLVEDATEVVKDVNGGGDAKDAVEELSELKEDLAEVVKRGKAIDEEASDEEKKEMKKELEETFGKELEKAFGELMGETGKLSTSGTVGAADVAKAVGEFMKEMN